MEKQNKKIFSTILMTVGVLFIIISGGIFVSRTWQYLPMELKNILLVAVAGGFFAGSLVTDKKGNLKITSTAFYYLGVFFTGFSTLSILSMLDISKFICFAIMQLVMMIPVLIRFQKKTSIADYIFELLLLDGTLVSMTGYSTISNANYFLVSLAIVTFALAIMLRYSHEKIFDNYIFVGIVISFYVIHAIVLLFALPIFAFVTKSILIYALAIALFIGAFSVIYMTYQNTANRVLQSSVIIYGLYLLSFAAFHIYGREVVKVSPSVVFFAPFVASVLLQIVLRRKEFLFFNLAVSILSCFCQVTLFRVYGHLDYTNDKLYPYVLCMAISLLLWIFITKDNENKKTAIKLSAVLGLMQANLLVSILSITYTNHYSFCIFVSLLALLASAFIKEDQDIKSVLRSIAWIFTALGLLTNAPFPVAGDAYNFRFEYIWALYTLTIVLFVALWYHRKESFQWLQFLLVSTMIVSLMLRNFFIQELPNVLFFSIVTLIFLLLSTIKKNKACAILCAIALAIVALYLTKAVWMSISWWVYLMIAGIALVILAIRKEKTEVK